MRPYEATDYPTLSDWFRLRGLRAPGFNDYPPFGLIVDDTAAGFMILTDIRVGILEFFVSNPKADVQFRKTSMDQIIEGLTEYAKQEGMTALRCDTQLRAIQEKAIQHGFRDVGTFQGYYKEI